MSPCLVTPCEARILDLLAKGKRNKEIAVALDCAERTIKEHIRVLMWKLHIEDRKRITLARYWTCELFKLGAGYEAPLSNAAAVIERDRMREKARRKLANPAD